jgi:CBS domain-containing protein
MTTTSPDADLERRLGTVGEAMTDEVVLLEADTPADAAVRRLERTWVSGAPVIDRGRVVGVVTLRDVLNRLAPDAQTTGPFLRRERDLVGVRVRDLMTPEVATARPERPLGRAVCHMVEAGVNRLPVVDAHGRPVGILTRDDVVGALARRLRGRRAPAHGSLMEPG